MSEQRPPDLLYGHFGECVYDAETHNWHFARKPLTCPRIRFVGAPTEAVRPATRSTGRAFEHVKNTTTLTAAHPELVPGSSILQEYAQTSVLIEGIVSDYDANKSDLLASGQVTSTINSKTSRKTHPIIALAAGAAGELLKLVLLSKEQLGWQGNRRAGVHRWTASGGEEAWWGHHGNPIQQLVFAEPNTGSGTWLAARFLDHVSVFRPVLNQIPVSSSGHGSHPFHLPSSRLDARHTITLSNPSRANVSFADVSFNPWDKRQIITTDQASEWCIWTLGQVKEMWSVSRSRALDPRDKTCDKPAIQADGWGRCLWVGDRKTIMIASRRVLAIFDLTSPPRRLLVPDLALARSVDWILDARRCQLRPDVIFVVTTSRIFWLQVSTVEATRSARPNQAGAVVLLSWVHFRDPEDYSLQLSVHYSSEDLKDCEENSTTTLVLYSRQSNLCTAFTTMKDSTSGRVISSIDPYVLPLTHADTNQSMPKVIPWDGGARRNISRLIVRPLKYGSFHGRPSSGLAEDSQNDNVAFYQLSILYNDLSLSESIFAHASSEYDSRILAPDVNLRQDVFKTPSLVTDDYISPNGPSCEANSSEMAEFTPESVQERTLQASLKSNNSDERTIDLGWLFRQIRKQLIMRGTRSTGRRSDAEFGREYHEDLESAIREQIALANPTISTLLELGGANFAIPDIDSASVAMKEIIESALDCAASKRKQKALEECSDLDNQVTIPSLLTPALRNILGIDDGAQMSRVYDGLVQAFIFHLPSHIPGRTRIAIERALRDTTAVICLSSHGVSFGPEKIAEQARSQEEAAVPKFLSSLPLRRKALQPQLVTEAKAKVPFSPSSPAAVMQTSMDVGFAPSSATYTLPTPESTPSLASQSSVSSGAASEDPSSSRLGNTVSLRAQPILPDKMRNILAHWTLGVDPARYDWDVAQQAQDIDEGEGMRQRERQHHRVSKRLKRVIVQTDDLASQTSPRFSNENQIQGSGQNFPEEVAQMDQPKGRSRTMEKSKASSVKRKARAAGF